MIIFYPTRAVFAALKTNNESRFFLGNQWPASTFMIIASALSLANGFVGAKEKLLPDPVFPKCLRGLQKLVAKPIKRKSPFTPEHVRKIVKTAVDAGNSLLHMRTALFFRLGFLGFLRVSELQTLIFQDITAMDSHLHHFKIRYSKCDKLRNGQEVIVAATVDPYCPVAMFLRHSLLFSDILEG